MKHRGTPQGGVKPPFGTLVNWQNPLTRGLVAAYLLNEGHGNAARDSTGNGLDLFYDGTATNNISWTGMVPNINGEQIPRSLSPVPVFAGNPHRFIAPASLPRLNSFTEGVSVEFWWWHDTDSVANPVPVAHGVNTRFLFVKSSATNLIWRINVSTDVTDTAAFANNPNRRWVHFVGTYDRVNQKLYRDGLERVSNPTSAALATTAGQFCIGDASGGANWANGNIGLVRVWDRALHPDEVMQIYQDPFGMYAYDRRRVFVEISVVRDAIIPVDSLGQIQQDRDAVIPVDSLGHAFHDAVIPVDSKGYAFRDAVIPVDSRGVDPFSLAHAWNVRKLYNSDLLHQWDVTSTLFSSSLLHQWNIRASIFNGSLTHTWRVIPNLPQTFSNDIQCPVADIDVTT